MEKPGTQKEDFLANNNIHKKDQVILVFSIDVSLTFHFRYITMTNMNIEHSFRDESEDVSESIEHMGSVSNREKDEDENMENAEAALALGLLDVILEYPHELESFTYRELMTFYSKNVGKHAPTQEVLNFLIENEILIYEGEEDMSGRYFLNHSNHLVAKRAMEANEEGMENNANLRISNMFNKKF